MNVELLTPKEHLTTEPYLNALRQSFGKNEADYVGREGKVLAGCLKNNHNTVLEQQIIQFEIETKIAITRELNRHRPLNIVEMSTRYVEIDGDFYELPEDIIKDEVLKIHWTRHLEESMKLYNVTLNSGLPKQVARDILPLCTKTVETVSGTLWDWIKFIRSRLVAPAHIEIRGIAREIYLILNDLYPEIITVENLEHVKPIKLVIEEK